MFQERNVIVYYFKRTFINQIFLYSEIKITNFKFNKKKIKLPGSENIKITHTKSNK